MSRPFEKLRALVIEDEPLVAMFIEDLLIEMGHEIGATVAQPAEALGAAETGSFGIAIVDVNLNGTPSYPVAKILQARGIPFVFVTGYGVNALDPSFVGASTLRKPFGPKDLQLALPLAIAPK